MKKKDKERRVYPKDFKAEAVALAEKAREAGMPGSIGFGDQRKAVVPVDTAGPGSGRNRLAALPRARTAPGRGTDPLAEGK
jgi:hypothetical protein